MTREFTYKLLEMIEQGIVSSDHVVLCCLKYMSEDDVRDMMECNEIIEQEDDLCSDNIIINDWAGNVLFKGDYRDKEVDKILDANRCQACNYSTRDNCDECNGTGYSGDIEVCLEDEDRDDNVYEYINY